MAETLLYHGSSNRDVSPKFGLGNDHHDYGRGFYLTEQLDLAKEWAVSRPLSKDGWVHTFRLDLQGLRVLDFEELGVYAWLAELMKHRSADQSRRYRLLSREFIDKFAVDSSEYDVVRGWRANASYFFIAREFVRDNIDVSILPELLSLGDLGIQYCLKTARAYQNLSATGEVLPVDYETYNQMYNERDSTARQKMSNLVESERNTLHTVFSTLLRG